MKALKWVAIGLGAGGVLAGGIVWLVFSLTSGAVEAAEAFLRLVGQGRYEEAYRAVAPQFRPSQDLGSFRATMQRSGLDKYEAASWSSRRISGGWARLRGTIRTGAGGRVPVVVELVSGNEAWLVYSIRLGGAGALADDDSRDGVALDPAAMKRLALQSLLDFNDAVRSGDFAAFHAKLARPMREQYTPERLRAAFQVFVDQKIDLAPIAAVEPIFEPREARADSGGQLPLKGRFPTRPSEVAFDLAYILEGGDWRLVKINVQVRPPQ